MKRKTKKFINLFVLSSVCTIPIYFSSSCSCSCTQNDVKTEKILTKEIVNDNFLGNGIWANKDFLQKDDFKEFNEIAYDAFDFLNKELEYIELPSNIQLNEIKAIKWSNVKEIKVFKTSITYFKVINEILFYDDNAVALRALTLSNRNKEIDELSFLNINKEIWITDFFYQENIFKNVNKIKLIDDKNISKIGLIGVSAFENCQKLQENLIFNIISDYFDVHLYINKKAFYNTNIKTLIIECSSLTNFGWKHIIIGDSAFENCINLSTIYINWENLSIGNWENISIGNNSFKNVSKNLLVFLNSQNLFFSNNCFSNEYDNFNFVLSIFENIFTEENGKPFNGIDIKNINNFNFTTYKKWSDLLKDVGFSEEEYKKINFINS